MYKEQLPIQWQSRWETKQFNEATAIQNSVFEPLSKGQSIVGISPTGSGKTLAYLLPMLQSLKPGEGNQCLVLASSQELAMQVFEVANEWAQDISINVQSAIGGANVQRQVEKLRSKPEMIVGTPGRVLELIRAKKINAFQVNSVILDEADQLINQNQQGLAKNIIQAVGKKSMFSFFSATADSALDVLKELVAELSVIDVTKDDSSQGIVRHQYLYVPSRRSVDILRRFAHTDGFQGLIFFNQLSDLGSAEEKLQFNHIKAASLASDQSKEMRKMGLNLFKQKTIQLLLATDIAARGIDIDQLPFVVNAEVPLTRESYLHRAGRVGRMGAKGTVITLVNEYTIRDLKKLANQLEITLEEIYLYSGAIQTEKPETKQPFDEKKKSKPSREKESDVKIQSNEKPTYQLNSDSEFAKDQTKVKKKKRTKDKKNKGKRKKTS